MNAIQLLILSALTFAAAGLLSLLLRGSDRAARVLSGLGGAAASVVGLIAALAAFTDGDAVLELAGFSAFGHFALHMDGFSAFMVGAISLLALAASIYSIGYVHEYRGRGCGELGFFNNIFIAAMLMVVTIANAFYFLIFWELMTLASYFLVIFEQEKKESVSAGYLYFLIAHIGTALIMLSFFILYQNTGSFDFESFRSATLPLGAKSLIFLLAFFGFGAKAGIVPLHIWLPRAHPAAPSHVSALLSGVMIKTAIYGLIRLCVDILGTPLWWWGFVVLCFGGLSALLGIVYALDERDLKRLLAYSSVENVGIILMGVGVGMMGMSLQLPALAAIGFLAALYHLLNHAMFKGLLFMGAGAVVYSAHTRNMNEMGGLARAMPWTSFVFLVGAVAISAIPPLNGFVSEWFVFQSLFIASNAELGALRVFAPLFAVLLGLVGAMAAMTFVKAYGTTFTGQPRSIHAKEAVEVPGSMLAGMSVLAIAAVLLGLAAPWVAPFIGGIAAQVANVPAETLANGIQIFPGNEAQGVLSTPIIFLLLAGLLAFPLVAVFALGGHKAGQRVDADPWACGYGYQPQMGISATNFAQPMLAAYRPLYALRALAQKPLDGIASLAKRFGASLPAAEPVLERSVSQPIFAFVRTVGGWVQRMQMGDLRMYCLYIFIALAVLLIVIFE
jgi:hydrogenase-4 component B